MMPTKVSVCKGAIKNQTFLYPLLSGQDTAIRALQDPYQTPLEKKSDQQSQEQKHPKKHPQTNKQKEHFFIIKSRKSENIILRAGDRKVASLPKTITPDLLSPS